MKEMAALVEIEPILDRYPSSISGGQQQRASLARALVRPADLYLLDEPMGQLEPRLRALLRGRLKQLLTERGMTSIFVTHDQTEANALADRVAVMEGGVLQQLAGQIELKERPANLFVATFIGEPPMNVFDAKVEVGERVRFEVANGPKFDFSANEFGEAARSALARRARGVIGVRPHDVRLGIGRQRSARRLQSMARRSEPSRARRRGQADGGGVVRRSSRRARRPAALRRLAAPNCMSSTPIPARPYRTAARRPEPGSARWRTFSSASTRAPRSSSRSPSISQGEQTRRRLDAQPLSDPARRRRRSSRMAETWEDCAKTLRELGEQGARPRRAHRRRRRDRSGRRDLVGRRGQPAGRRGLAVARRPRRADGAPDAEARPPIARAIEATGSGLNVCQQGTQLAHMLATTPDVVAAADAAMHCKDWLYLNLTGVSATDPSEACFTFGDFRKRAYDDDVIATLGLTKQRRLLPPILDGVARRIRLTRRGRCGRPG